MMGLNSNFESGNSVVGGFERGQASKMNFEFISNDGRLLVPLFHGTSVYFWNLIISTGLNARNIISDWRIHDLFRELVGALAAVDDEDVRFELKRARSRIMITLKDAGASQASGTRNFRYGGTYLAGRAHKAAGYACRGFGSELVRECVALFELLFRLEPETALTIARHFPEFEQCRRADHRPVLVTVTGLQVAQLRDEQGLAPDRELEGLALGLQATFELTGKVARHRLSASLIKSRPDEWGLFLSDSELELELIRRADNQADRGAKG